MFSNLLVLAGGIEELWENNVLVVARLLHRADRRAAASEYFRAGTIDAVADVCPYLLSQPFGSEYLLGNTFIAVAQSLNRYTVRFRTNSAALSPNTLCPSKDR